MAIMMMVVIIIGIMRGVEIKDKGRRMIGVVMEVVGLVAEDLTVIAIITIIMNAKVVTKQPTMI